MKNAESLRIVENAKNILGTACQGLEDFKNKPSEKKLHGLRNMIVFGRATTNILQKLRSTEIDFENWYSKYQQEMRNDPLMKYFYDLRSKILKEGDLPLSSNMYIGDFKTSELVDYPRPPNAKSFFIGDQIGGSGWIVELPDGTTEKYYLTLKNDSISIDFNFPDSAKYHLGQDISKKTVPELCDLYFDYLKKLIKSAEKEFCAY